MRIEPMVCWRWLVIRACFVAFCIGGILLAVTVFPAMRLLGRGDHGRRPRWLIHKSFSALVWILVKSGVMTLDVVGGEKLRNCRDVLVLANHPTYLDVVVLISLMPLASCIIKKALWANPFFGGVVRAADYIRNSDAETLIDDCAVDLSKGNPLVIFPEGTRSAPGQPLKFQRGAAHIMLKTDKRILPVLIHCTPAALSTKDAWLGLSTGHFHIHVEVGEPIAAARWIAPNEKPAIAARKITAALQQHFSQELERLSWMH